MSSISLADAERTSAVPVHARGDGELIYRRATRHSRLVRVLRIGLLVTIAGALLIVVARNYLPLGGVRLPVGIGSMVIDGTKITMQQPRLTGYTDDNRAYEFSANSAAQDITTPDLVQLQQIHAKFEMADKSMVHMWADSGVYNMKSDLLTLKDHIRLVSSTGYEALLKQAVVDVRKGNVVSDSPVWVKLLDGDLTAKHLDIINKGDVLHFTDVTLTLQSGKPDAKAGRP